MPKETATRLLDTAQSLMQRRGYNAFSYKDLAESVGIRTASIHYHFPSKADLGKALIDRYLAELEHALATIDREARTNKAKLESFIALYRDTETAGAICLCGSLASDRESLPEPIQAAVSVYLERSEAWVVEKISEGVRLGELEYSGEPVDAAAVLVSSLQGGLILSRAKGGCSVLDTVERVLFQTLGVAR